MRRQAKASSAGSNTRQATGLGRPGIAPVAFLVLLALCGIGAPAALADESRLPESFSPLTGAGSGVTITDPSDIALDEATGNVFLNDGDNGSNPQVTDILGKEGGAPVGLVAPFRLTGFCFPGGNNLSGVAFDNSATSPSRGTLYVVDCGNRIKKFTRNPATEKYEPAGELTSSVTFEFGASAAVDTHGNIFVTDIFGPGFSGAGVVKFNPAGTQVARYSLANSLRAAVSLAVDADGDLFVGGGGSVYKFPVAGLPPDGSDGLVPANPVQISSEGSGANALAVDPARNKLYIGFGSRVAQYDATTLEKEIEFGSGTPGSAAKIAVDSTTNRIYLMDRFGKNVAVYGPPIVLPSATTKAASNVTGAKATLSGIVNPHGNAITECLFEYGPTTSYGSTVPCEGSIPTDSNEHSVSAAIGGLTPNGTTYHFRLVVQSINGPAFPQGADRTLVTGSTVFTEPATSIGSSSATLNGLVKPEGTPFTDCKFEYGTATDYGHSVPCSPAAGAIADDFDAHPVAGAPSGLEPNTTYHFRLSATNAAGTVLGQDRSFTTSGPPQILEQRPANATQTAVTLQAKIDPSGSPTTYHFEFGADTSYGTRIPADHDLFAGTGTESVVVNANRTGLQERSVYHFRVIATNASGTTVGPDRRIETLNADGLPDNRGFEMVTPADKGTAGSIADILSGQPVQPSLDGQSFVYPLLNGLGTSTAGGNLRYRAERTSEGWLTDQISPPSLISPPSVNGLEIAMPSRFRVISPDNNCGFIETYNPLTPDTPVDSVELGVTNLYRWSADGGYELVSNRLPLNPRINTESSFFESVVGSGDCNRVYFKSPYELISGASGLYEWDEGTLRDAGTLPNGKVGASLGGFSGRAVLGGEVNSSVTSSWGAVSSDGKHLFFTAIANQGPSTGKPAIFMRQDDPSACEPSPSPCTVEISASDTAVPTKGARFEAASPDGSHVFFRANYGIAAASSAGPTNGACGPLSEETETNSPLNLEQKPCDLYAYDVETGDLTDLTADPDSPGAQIQGTIAVDEDGSSVYFATLGQLIPGKGRTYAENTAQNSTGFGSANVYLYRTGQPLTYVTTLANHGSMPSPGGSTGDLLGISGSNGAALMRISGWNADTTPDGSRLLFTSSRNLTGWDSGANYKYAAYLWSVDTGRLECISCRPDGLPSVALPARGYEKVGGRTGTLSPQSASLLVTSNSTFHQQRHSMSEDGSRIVFMSPDVLASGAVEGELNAYLWEEGQVFFLAVLEQGGVGGWVGYQGMSLSGDDIFLATNEKLLPQDRDSLSDIYDVRVNGGFPTPVSPPNCQVDESVPLEPNQIYCQGDRTAAPTPPSPASAGVSGSGNPPQSTAPSKPCPKGKVKRRGRCVKPRTHVRHHKRKHDRAAKTNTGGAK